MLSPIEVFQQMVKSDTQFVNNSTLSSFNTFKQRLSSLGFSSRSNSSFISETLATTTTTQSSHFNYQSNQTLNKIDEWQRRQDQLVQQLAQSKSKNMYIPNYPPKQSFDLRSRFEQHNAQSLQINISLDNKFQRSPSLIAHMLDSQIISDLSEHPISKSKTKDDEQKKKSNLKTSAQKTVEKKSVKIEEKRKSQSETIPGKKPRASKSEVKPPKTPDAKLKKQKSNSSLSSPSPKKKSSKPGVESVDSFLQQSKKKKK
ncbi:unnamed protein product (macronuclear) [Paramecium tetraurelia]|uniref:Uncharacterized protein n=1 Tax=Paramecium tetraurelia TaxID=5888 RepID=A0BXL3_PARTE|nr:uncharacterized protein GSPATT00033133001 [Paramecium tetraurelia]CAK63280.1 unnamed protein product [Paramecium tetraurelia]|eukprot:XP_001430678.1 hypothetical protein (macronuclear) [Paramecium tetraurelia strain d4-2]